jgi:hypothetical protein
LGPAAVLALGLRSREEVTGEPDPGASGRP